MSIFKELEKLSLSGLKRTIAVYPNSVNSKNSDGATPLHVAAGLGQAAFVKELLVHGAQYEATDGQGNIPLHLAAEQGSVETVVELLAGRKTTTKAKNKEGQTPLHLAVHGGHKEVVVRLLEANSRTDVKDKAGDTPLSLAEDEEMRHILTNGKAPSGGSFVGQGPGPANNARGVDGAPGSQRGTQALGTGASVASTGGRLNLALSSSYAGSEGGGPAAAVQATPRTGVTSGGGGRTPQASYGGTAGSTAGARTPPTAPTGGSSGSFTNRVPRSSAAAQGLLSPVHSSGGATGLAAGQHQQQKHDMAIQSLKEGLRAATERLAALDTCTAAQLETAGQVEKALEACGHHGRSILDLETRVAFQEERGRDARIRIERLEESERDRQDSAKRLADEHRLLSSQLHRLADQVAANSNGVAQRHQSFADAGSQMQGQHQLQAELAVLRAQVDQLAPALALATAASAEARTLAARLDVVQQQLQKQQQPPAQQHAGSNVVLEQQVVQLQAQVQLLQLPMASLTQQCADLSGRVGSFSEWQQQARTELARLAEGMEQAAGNKLADAVMGILDTTARSLSELRQQQDETSKKVAMLVQQQQQAALPASPSPSTGPPAVPSTPHSASQRTSGAFDPALGPFGGPPSRNHNGHPSLGSISREISVHAEVRTELESLKSLVSDVRKEVATEGGSLRREWQRAFSEMQSRYGEQTNELRAREANIAKLREAALVEEAERRAASGFEEKFSERLSKLETNVEYLTHRLEVLEEQVSGVVSSLAGATSPVAPLSPSRMAAAMAALRGQPVSSRSGPGPISENHSSFAPLLSNRASTPSMLSPTSQARHGRHWSAAGPPPAAPITAAGLQSDGGCLRRRGLLHGAVGAKESVAAAGGPGGCSAGGGAASARDAQKQQTEPEEWWQAAVAESDERQGAALDDVPVEAAGPHDARDEDSGASFAEQRAAPKAKAAAIEAMGVRLNSAAAPRSLAVSAPGGAALHQLSARGNSTAARTEGGVSAVAADGGGGGAIVAQRERPCEEPLPAVAALTQRDLASARGSLTARGQGMVSWPAVQPMGGSEEILDPANLALGPQLLTPVAHALLSPSVDIQRLAVAALAQQQQQQQPPQNLLQQQHRVAQQPVSTFLPLSNQHQPHLAASSGAEATALAGTVGPGRPAAMPPDARGEEQGPARKEPPLCLFCPMQ